MAFNSEEAVSQPPSTAAVIAAASTPISTSVLTDDHTGTTDSEGGDPEIIERKDYVNGLCPPSTLAADRLQNVSASNHGTDVHGVTPAGPNLISARSLIFEFTHKNGHRRGEVLITNGETELDRPDPQQVFTLLPRNGLIHMVPNDKLPQMVDIACGAGNATIRGLDKHALLEHTTSGAQLHQFEILKSESSLIQWMCSMCHSGPHWFIYQCMYCKLNSCRLCSEGIETE